MKNFDYTDTPKRLLSPDIVAILTSIHEHKGKQELFIEANSDALTMLMEIAKITSKGQITIPIGIRKRLGINRCTR